MLGRDRMIDYEIYGKDGNIIEMSKAFGYKKTFCGK